MFNKNDITHLGQTEASGAELMLNQLNYWTFVFTYRLKNFKLTAKKKLRNDKKKDMNIKPQGLPTNARLEKRTNLIWKSNVLQESRRTVL